MLGNLLMGFSLKSVLEMINALQIIILLPLIDTKIPANAHMFFSRLTETAAFDFIEIGDFVQDFLELPLSNPVNERFEASGMESTYYINNLGTFYLIIWLYFLLVIFWLIFLILWMCTDKKCFKKWHYNLQTKLFWNGLIVTVTESFVVVALCTFLSFHESFSFKSYGMKVQNYSLIVIFLAYLIIPLVVLIGVLRNFN